MNAHFHMSGQISGQVSTQATMQVSGPAQQIGSSLSSQKQGLAPRNMEHDINACRRKMQEKICNFFQKNVSSEDWLRRVPEYARRMEERLFKDPTIRDNYLSLVMDPTDLRLHALLRKLISQRQSSSYNVANSTIHNTTMIPTPGMSQDDSSNAVLSNPVMNPTISTSHSNVIPQPITNMRNLQSTTKSSLDLGNSGSMNALGSVSNVYQQQTANFAFDSTGGSVMPSMTNQTSSQFPQMIPTPGYNTPQSAPINAPINADTSNGVSLSSSDSNLIAMQQQQKIIMGSQNSHAVHGLGGQNNPGSSNMLLRKSSYGFSNELTNSNLGFAGSNMQTSAPVMSKGLQGASSYGTSLIAAQQLDQQNPNAGISGTDVNHGQGSSVLSSMNGLNATNLQSKLRTNSSLLNHHSSLHSLQSPSHIRTHHLDHQQKLKFQLSHLRNNENLLQPLQQTQLELQPSQNFEKFAQSKQQYQQPNPQNQHFMPMNSALPQNSVNSHLGEQIDSKNASAIQSAPLISSAHHQPAEFQHQYQHSNSIVGYEKNSGHLGHGHGSQDFHVTLSQDAGQIFQPSNCLQTDDFSNRASVPSSGIQPQTSFQSQWQLQLPQSGQSFEKVSSEQLQAEFHQRINGQKEAQQPQIFVEQQFSHSVSNSVPQLSRAVSVPYDSLKAKNYVRQSRWLLFMIHARSCSAPKGQCLEVHCTKVQDLLAHMKSCKNETCRYARCHDSKKLLDHFKTCKEANCPVCSTVHNFVVAEPKSRALAYADTVLTTERKLEEDKLKTESISVETSDESQLVSKRMRIEEVFPTSISENDETLTCIPRQNDPTKFKESKPMEYDQDDTTFSVKLEVTGVKIDQSTTAAEEKLQYLGRAMDGDVEVNVAICHRDSRNTKLADGHANKIMSAVKRETEQLNYEDKHEEFTPPVDQATGSKSGKPNIKGVSLTELFTPEQIREHILGLRQWVGQSKAKAEKNQAMEHSMTENSCQLCAVEKLKFDPPPLYCSLCGARIKRNAMYYTIGGGDTRHYFCIPCYNEVRGDSIQVDGSNFLKSRMDKKRNDEETEEGWVQCDKCEAWQHQICALFNGRRNDGQAEYTCPNCYVAEIEMGQRKPLAQSAVLGAKDLPRTILSDFIEQRLFRRLKHERIETARHLGKNYDEVQGAEGLVVRVVSSVDKKLEVKPRFLELFQEENYPKEFPYKSKVVLLFQKIEGVEVCLFGMYVQEFGSECAFPNQRRVYLSYLDSVKYFRPERKTLTGEALRTFVYHEILIGYLEYCKKRGFTSCYIWACPPLKGEDYILYCHPEIQKTPKSDKLREWYLSMLRKASKENIVVELTNLYDHFFVTMGECKAKVTAARLPYFDGDYWPGAAEDMIILLHEEEDGTNKYKKGAKKAITKRALKAAGQTGLSGNASKDALLMQKLGETIFPMKEDFIMVHLQHCCNHCCILMVSGTRWVCKQCKNFQLCGKCYEAENVLDDRERHPIHGRDKHIFSPVEINDVASDTKDKDEILESEFFDTRQAFLSLCQGNHYQYDTLRRAKHSSMMILYHLHNPTAPAFVTTCNICQHEIETGQGWRCEICPEFDVCNSCYLKGDIDHPHKLTNNPSTADRDAQNKEARQQRVQQLRKMLDLLVHASQCRFPQCQYPNCRKVKGLFRHGMQCKKRVAGGCVLCKKMWYLLQLHARACKESGCPVPRCSDLKEHLRRMQQQSDSRRRAAVTEMMRQRAAEVAGNS